MRAATWARSSPRSPRAGSHYDAATRDLSITVRSASLPGRVRTLSLQPNTAQPQNGLIAMPAWTRPGNNTPMRQGMLESRCTTGRRATGPCPTLGATLLGAVATLRVPAPAGERVLRVLAVPRHGAGHPMPLPSSAGITSRRSSGREVVDASPVGAATAQLTSRGGRASVRRDPVACGRRGRRPAREPARCCRARPVVP